MDELERQIEALIDAGVPVESGLSPGDLRSALDGVRPLLPDGTTQGFDPSGAPFVAVPAPRSLDCEALIPLVTLAGGRVAGVLDRNHGDEGLSRYRDVAELGVPVDVPYLLVDIERGEEFCDVRPRDAVTEILARGRSPLTILEGIVLQLVRPDLLVKNRCFMLAGSRRGDRRIPALWISGGAPKLGWCWEGNPHSWLGTASAAARRVQPVD